MKYSFNQYVELWNIVPNIVNVTPKAKSLLSIPANPDTPNPINTIIIPTICIQLNFLLSKILFPKAFHIVNEEYKIIYNPDPRYNYPTKVKVVPKISKAVIISNYFHIDLTNINLLYFYGKQPTKAIAIVLGISYNKVGVYAAPFSLIYSKIIVFKAPDNTYNVNNVPVIEYFMHFYFFYNWIYLYNCYISVVSCVTDISVNSVIVYIIKFFNIK